MAGELIGIGIGLSGIPKDYTSLAAARQRQKQLGELEEKKQKKSLLDPVMKSIAVDKNLYMDYRIPEVREKTAEFVTKAQQAAESSDINALAMAQQEYNTYVQQMVAERKMFDEDLKNYEAGTALMVKDPRLLRQAKTLEEARKLAEENPDDFFVSEYGTVSAKPIKPLNIQSFYQKAADDLRTGEAVPTQIIINGKPATVMVRPIDKQQFEDRMRTDFRSNQGIQQTTRVNFTLEGGDLKGLTPAEKAKKLEDYYVQQGAVYLGRDPQNVFTQRSGNVYNFGGDQSLGIGEIQESNIEVGFQPQERDAPLVTESVSNSKGYSVPPFKASVTQTSNLRSMDTGEKINNSAVSEFEIGEFRLVPVYKSNKRGYNIAGKIVSDKGKALENAKDNVEWKVIATGQGEIYKIDPNTKAPVSDENGRPIKEIVRIYRDAKEVTGSLAGKLNPNQFRRHNDNYLKLQKEADELNRMKTSTKSPNTIKIGGGKKVSVGTFFEKK